MESNLVKVLRSLEQMRKTMNDGVLQIECPVCGKEAMVKRDGIRMDSQCVGGRCYSLTVHD